MATTKSNFDKKRRDSGATPVVNPSKPPLWLKRKIIACIKQMARDKGNEHDVPDMREHVSHLFYEHVLSELDELHGTHIFTELYDHSGRTKINGDTCFVLEPYPDSAAEEWERQLDFAVDILADALDCYVGWSAVSWHYPEHTYRILFSEKLPV